MMARYVIKIATSRSPQDVFAYLSDLTNSAQWDPGISRAEAVGTVDLEPPREVEITVEGRIRPLTLRYRIDHYEPPRRAVAKAETRLLRLLDVILVEAADDGCVVTYDAGLTLKGPLSPFGGLLQPAFGKIGGRVAAGMAAALDGTLVTT